MCGIAGAFVRRPGQRIETDALFCMVDALNHRGPESVGYWVDADHRVMLMHARMAMVDPEGGGQPMSNENGAVWISLNGEIYDFRRQSRQLMDRGHRFRSRCDVEVVPHLYEDHGIDCLSHLRGEFALALYDARQRTLYLARDRFGTKPLFYAEAGGTIVFGSEAKAVLAHPAITPELDTETLKLLFLGLPLPDRSVFAGLRQVRPGHVLKITRGRHGGTALVAPQTRARPLQGRHGCRGGGIPRPARRCGEGEARCRCAHRRVPVGRPRFRPP